MSKTKLLIVLLAVSTIANAQGTWTKKADVGGTASRYAAISFSIGTKGYVGLGVSVSSFGPVDFWEWDQATNVWTQKANFPGGYRLSPAGFSIGTKGYVGTGSDGGSTYYKDFWEWNQATGTWTQKANFGGGVRYLAAGFSIGTKGYLGTGMDLSTVKNDLWEYDQATGTWLQKANVGGPMRLGASGFSIGTKGYVGTGQDGFFFFQDFWEYNPATDAWTQKADFGGTPRFAATGFSIGTKGYLGTGGDSSSTTWIQSDFWEYDPNGNGVNEMNLSNSISVYPNPSNGKAIVQMSKFENLKIKSMEIYNTAGEKIYLSDTFQMGSFSNPQIDLRSQPNGIYFLQIKTDQGIAAKKIIIQK